MSTKPFHYKPTSPQNGWWRHQTKPLTVGWRATTHEPQGPRPLQSHKKTTCWLLSTSCRNVLNTSALEAVRWEGLSDGDAEKWHGREVEGAMREIKCSGGFIFFDGLVMVVYSSDCCHHHLQSKDLLMLHDDLRCNQPVSLITSNSFQKYTKSCIWILGQACFKTGLAGDVPGNVQGSKLTADLHQVWMQVERLNGTFPPGDERRLSLCQGWMPVTMVKVSQSNDMFKHWTVWKRNQ